MFKRSKLYKIRSSNKKNTLKLWSQRIIYQSIVTAVKKAAWGLNQYPRDKPFASIASSASI